MEMKNSGGDNIHWEGKIKSLISRDMEAEDVDLGVVSKKTLVNSLAIQLSPSALLPPCPSSPVPQGTRTHSDEVAQHENARAPPDSGQVWVIRVGRMPLPEVLLKFVT